jgi:hypothetical protein
MKSPTILIVIAVILALGSCKKDEASHSGADNNISGGRKVRYELYTNEDFTGDQHNIQFSLFMKNAGKTIFDSSLSPMKVEEIPDSIHKIIIEKYVPGNDGSTLTVGFVYQIENVGISWYLDTFPAGDTLKLLQYRFK